MLELASTLANGAVTSSDKSCADDNCVSAAKAMESNSRGPNIPFISLGRGMSLRNFKPSAVGLRDRLLDDAVH